MASEQNIALRAVVLDIEGTATPISFVADVLFPYARRHGRKFILNHLADQEMKAALEELRIQNAIDCLNGAPTIPKSAPDTSEATILYYLWLMEADRKLTALKTIQGRIWQEGYARGDLRSIIFPDVAPALRSWREQGRITAIYSSGSVLAQKELFAHTQEGDLTSLIAAYFDTTTGAKQEPASYRKIAESLLLPAPNVLFISDVPAELDAALTAGMRTALSVRPGNEAYRKTVHPAIHSFDEVLPISD